MNSIRRQLMLWLIGSLLAVAVIAAGGLYFRINDEANLLSDYHLEQLALSLRNQVLAQGPAQDLSDPDYDLIIQIWSSSGERMYFSHPHSTLPNRARLGLDTVSTPEGAWRVFSIQMPDRTIQVAQTLDVRQAQARKLAVRTLLPFAVLLPILGLALWGIVGRSLKPLDRVAHDVAARSPATLAPLAEDGLPCEIAPIVRALNGLLGRLARSVETQRAFVADAAHELRSPIAAVQLQAQIAERAKTDVERSAALAQLRSGADRAIHMVQQLLTLARQEPDAAAREFEPVDLARLAKEAIAEQAPFAHARNLDLGMGRADSTTILGDGDALRAMLTNLIDNAIRYVPPGGKVDVSVACESGNAVIRVVDNGPGIPPEERKRVLDRFYRREASHAAGSGLGLAIVKNVASRHRAELVLGEGAGGQGLSVSVRFPNPDTT